MTDLDSGEEEQGWHELALARVCGLPGLDKGEEEHCWVDLGLPVPAPELGRVLDMPDLAR